MKLSVQINEGPYQHQATDTAYHFTKAALETGHEVMRVFFYHAGAAVFFSSATSMPPRLASQQPSSSWWSWQAAGLARHEYRAHARAGLCRCERCRA